MLDKQDLLTLINEALIESNVISINIHQMAAISDVLSDRIGTLQRDVYDEGFTAGYTQRRATDRKFR